VAKKLPCGHMFHSACLRSWFQRMQTCPTCRSDILTTPPPQRTQAQQAQQRGERRARLSIYTHENTSDQQAQGNQPQANGAPPAQQQAHPFVFQPPPFPVSLSTYAPDIKTREEFSSEHGRSLPLAQFPFYRYRTPRQLELHFMPRVLHCE